MNRKYGKNFFQVVTIDAQKNENPNEILHELRRIHVKYEKTLQKRLNDVHALCEEADNLRNQIDVTNYNDGLLAAQLEGVITEAALEFPQKTHTLHQTEQAEKAYCTTHNLIDRTIQPNAVVSTLLITIFMFVDAAANSSFLYNAHMVAGPLAALLISFLISLVNVTASALAGYLIGRFLNYGSNSIDADASEFKTVRDRARWIFKIYIGGMALFLLTIGLVRSTESLDRIGHSLVHYHEFLLTPEAIFLVILNVCIAAISFHKGRNGFVHPYADYSKYQQAVIAARDDLHGSYSDCVEAVEDICDAAQRDAKAHDKARSKTIEQYNKKVSQCHRAYGELKLAVNTAEIGFLTSATRLIKTRSVFNGRNESIPSNLLERFSFTDITMPNLPKSYQLPSDRHNKTALADARRKTVERLGKIFEHELKN